MGLPYANIELIRTTDLGLLEDGYISPEQVRKMSVRALVDSRALTLAINEKIKKDLRLKTLEYCTATLADGSVIETEMVGPVDIHFENRSTTVRALVMPEEAEVLLGAIPIEGMDVIIDLKREKLVVNPKSPDRPNMSLK
jgi:clan AA aspartic protease